MQPNREEGVVSAADHIVAIGASAGGLEPIEEFFRAMPPDSGMAFVVVQHLSPDHPSLMDELLSRYTTMPVHRVTDEMPIEPDTVYIIPPKTYMRAKDGLLRLTEQHRAEDVAPTPIDAFFESVAEEFGERASAIVLSGSGTDGSRGIRAVHRAGGRTAVQDATAKFDGMPRAAIDTGCIDLVLTPAEMPAFITGQEDEGDQRMSLVNASHGVSEIMNLIQARHGLDFSQYKFTTILRRIMRRADLKHAPSVDDYVTLIRGSDEELDQLYRDLLIGVTRFFRDEDAFLVLEHGVLPRILAEDREDGEEVRIWVVGCATGEEAYTVAMLTDEARSALGQVPEVRIFATDAHKGSIEFAGAGEYTEEVMDSVSPERRERYFTRTADGFKVNADLRSLITFAPHNILADAPFTRIDLVVCRNMLIYFKPEAQKRTLSVLHYALKLGGTLFMGPSETPGVYRDEFTPIDTHWRLYTKRRNIRLFRADELSYMVPRTGLPEQQTKRFPAMPTADTRLQAAYDMILNRVLPAGLLINSKRELVHSFGGARDLLQTPTGRISFDVLDLVTPELRGALGAALVRASRDRKAVSHEHVQLTLGGEIKAHTLNVEPIEVDRTSSPYMLVTVTEPEGLRAIAPPEPSPIDTLVETDGIAKEKISALEAELRYTRESLQATVEELETTNEELNATNEELIASNEELQSTNEELQSVNEELHTVNAEHQQKIAEMTNLSEDMENLLTCTNVGTIFLDTGMCVRKFTPAAQDHVRLREQDIGRPIEEIVGSIDSESLIERARRVFHTGEAESYEAVGGEETPLLVTVQPYRTTTGSITGVVVTLVATDTIKEAQQREEHKTALRAQRVLDSIPARVWHRGADGVVISANVAAVQAHGLTLEDVIGARTDQLPMPNAIDIAREDLRIMADGHARRDRLVHVKDGTSGERWLRTDRYPILNDCGIADGVIEFTTDVTALKQTQDELREAKQRLELSLGAAQQGMWDYSPDTGDVTLNDAWYTMLGYRPRELPMTFGTWERLIHPDDLAGARADLAAHLDGRTVMYDTLYRMETKAGAWKWIRAVGRLTQETAGETPRRMNGMNIDVDEFVLARLASQETVRDLLVSLRAAQQGVWMWNPSSGEVKVSDGWLAVLGYEPGEMDVRSIDAWAALAHKDDRARTRNLLKASAEDAEIPLDMSHRLRTKSGTHMWVRTTGGITERTESGQAVRMTGTMTPAPAALIRMLDEDTAILGQRQEVKTLSRPDHRPTTEDSLRVLVIDDDDDHISSLQHAFRSARSKPMLVSRTSGALGLEYLRVESQARGEAPVDVILLDLSMPDMGGHEVLAEIRADSATKSTPVIIMSNSPAPDDKLAAFEGGAVTYVVKPRTLDELKDTVRRIEETLGVGGPGPAS